MLKSNKKVFMVVTFFMLTGTLFLLSPQRSYAQPPPGGLPLCIATLNTCNENLTVLEDQLNTCNANSTTLEDQLDTCNTGLNTCESDLAACEAEGGQIFPGDGYPNFDAFGVSGHGPALSYTDNGDGTFTDDNTELMWEKKGEAGDIHDVNNAYTWTDTGDGDLTNPDGTLFTIFLNTLNNSCDGAGDFDCETDADCEIVGSEVCGFLGHQNWRIPNVKELQSIVDYSVVNPASSVPGPTESSTSAFYWSSTTFADFADFQDTHSLVVLFEFGVVVNGPKNVGGFARAVRP